MRLDHIAYRVKNRHKTVKFFLDAFGYQVQTEFDIQFDDGTTARCFALEPPEKTIYSLWTSVGLMRDITVVQTCEEPQYHLAPEIFVSDGDPDSIVGQWVAKRDNIGGIHHLAYQVDNVEETMREWQQKGYAEFTTENPLTCPDLTQVFTRPSLLTGVIYEFIQRGKHGFCQDNVRDLMNSTKDLDAKVSIDFPAANFTK